MIISADGVAKEAIAKHIHDIAAMKDPGISRCSGNIPRTLWYFLQSADKRFDAVLWVFDKFAATLREFEADKNYFEIILLALKSCTATNPSQLRRAHEIIAATVDANSARTPIRLKNKIIHIFGAAQRVTAAKSVFATLSDADKAQSASSVTAMMRCFVDNAFFGSAMALYSEFEHCANQRGNVRLHALALKTCAETKNFERGHEIARAVPSDAQSVPFRNTLIAFYGRCGDLESAQRVFAELEGDAVTVNAMMDALIENSRCKLALKLYNKFSATAHFKVDVIGQMMALRACSEIGAKALGTEIIERLPTSARRATQIRATMLSFFGSTQQIEKARALFDECERETVLVNALMSAYLASDDGAAALEIYAQCAESALHNDISHSLALRASLATANFQCATAVHAQLKAQPSDRWQRSTSLMVLLIAVYSKLGELAQCDALFRVCEREADREYARFERFELRDAFNAIIDAHGANGDLERALALFGEMKNRERCAPNIATFIILLKSCARCGDVERAEAIWSGAEFIGDDAVRFNAHIVNTLVDCLARRGLLHRAFERIAEFEKFHRERVRADKAEREFDKFNENNRHLMWTSLLAAAAKFNSALFGQFVFDEFAMRFDLDVIEAAPLLLKNIYAAKKLHESTR